MQKEKFHHLRLLTELNSLESHLTADTVFGVGSVHSKGRMPYLYIRFPVRISSDDQLRCAIPLESIHVR
jgi:hypothetical protein